MSKKPDWEDGMDREMRFHLEQQIRDYVAGGMTPQEARTRALREFGAVELAKDECRDQLLTRWVRDLAQDIRVAIRSLRKSPLLVTAVVLTLALGIGMNVSVFTILNGLLFEPHVDRDPSSFVHLSPVYSGIVPEFNPWAISTQDYRAYQDGAKRSTSQLTAWDAAQVVIGQSEAGQGESSPFLALLVTCNFFSVYGTEQPPQQAKMGRLFRPEECSEPGSAPVAVISEGFWKNQLGSDPQILGATLRLNRHPFTVIGVMPSGFAGILKGPGIWVPYTMRSAMQSGLGREDSFNDLTTPWLTVDGRLKPGATRGGLQAELNVIASQQDRLAPGRKTRMEITDGSIMAEPSVRAKAYWLAPLVMGALTLILLIACTNVTMLLLSRAAARQQEIAIRLSLGAGRMRLLRMLLTEGVILALGGGAISAYVLSQAPAVIRKLLWTSNSPVLNLPLDGRVLSYLAGVTLLAGCIAGLAPAFESLKADMLGSLRGHQSLFALAKNKVRNRRVLIGVQIAMSLVLLTGAGLFIRAQHNMFAADPGYDANHVLFVPVRLTSPPYTTDVARAFYKTLAERVGALNGVQALCYGSAPVPLSDAGVTMEEVRFPGQAKGSGTQTSVALAPASYFETLGIAMRRGRAFREGESNVAVVSEALARKMWPGADPIGQTIQTRGGPSREDAEYEVVGIARDIQSEQFGAVDGPRLYKPRDPRAPGLPLLVRFSGDGDALERSIKSVIAGMDRDVTVTPRTLRWILDDLADRFSVLVKLTIVLGMVAVLLAVIGIYGVVAFTVGQQAKELGIRMALGATRGVIVRSVLRSGARPILIGLGGGLVLTLGAASVLGKAFEAIPVALHVYDPVTYGAVAILLAASALAAMFGPALRAAGADPSRALRQD